MNSLASPTRSCASTPQTATQRQQQEEQQQQTLSPLHRQAQIVVIRKQAGPHIQSES